MKELAPIVLFVYERIVQTELMVKTLCENSLANESDLFIYSDAPRSKKAEKNVGSVRDFIKTISGFRSVTIIERDSNYGLSRSIIEGVSETIKQYGKVIVIEDDLVISPFFLKFMNDGLDLYEHDDRAISIHGYVYPVKQTLPSTFFLRGADCWGWATWERGWKLFQSNGSALLDKIYQTKRQNEFDFNGTYPYARMLKEQVEGKNDSWAVRWYASAFLENKFTLYPGTSLVNNISSDTLGTHTKSLADFNSELSKKEITVDLIPIEDSPIARKAFEDFFRNLSRPSISKLLTFARSLFHPHVAN